MCVGGAVCMKKLFAYKRTSHTNCTTPTHATAQSLPRGMLEAGWVEDPSSTTDRYPHISTRQNLHNPGKLTKGLY